MPMHLTGTDSTGFMPVIDLYPIRGAKDFFSLSALRANLKQGCSLLTKNWTRNTSPQALPLQNGIFVCTVLLMPRLARSSTNPFVTLSLFCTNSHCPALEQKPSVSIMPFSNSRLWLTDDCRYTCGMCLLFNTPNRFSLDFNLDIENLVTVLIRCGSSGCSPTAFTASISAARSLSETLMRAPPLSPSPSHKPNTYGAIGSSFSAYSTGDCVGTRYLYSVPLPSCRTCL